MTAMQIASYLGLLGMALNSTECNELERETLQAVREAQLIMYEKAREELINEIKAQMKEETDETERRTEWK